MAQNMIIRSTFRLLGQSGGSKCLSGWPAVVMPSRCLRFRSSINFQEQHQEQKQQQQQQQQQQLMQPLLQDQRQQSKPLVSEEDEEDFFKINDLFTIEDLFNARVHLGHKVRMYNPHMRPYIFGQRLGVLVFDLDITARLLRKALKVTAEIAYRDGIILFVHNSRQNNHLVEKAAKDCGEFAYCSEWKEAVFTDSRNFFGAVTRLPDLVILFTTVGQAGELHRCVTSSATMLIPTIGICDTNSDTTLVTYPVPGNDDTPQSIECFSELFKEAVLRGKNKRKEILETHGQEYYIKSLD